MGTNSKGQDLSREYRAKGRGRVLKRANTLLKISESLKL